MFLIFFVLSFFLSSQPTALTPEVLHSKQPPVVRKFSGDGPYELGYEHSCDLPPAHFCREYWWAECTSCCMLFVGAYARMTHQLQVHGRHHVIKFLLK